MKNPNRREFLIRVGTALIVVPPVLIASSCKKSALPTGPGPEEWDVFNDDNSGHTHTFRIECTQVMDMKSVVYTTTVGSNHSHQVTLTAANFEQLSLLNEVVIQTTDLHPHTWKIRVPNDVIC